MKQILLITSALLLSLSIVSCAALQDTHAPKPKWIDKPMEAYPEHSHLVGTGQGATLAIASDRARAELGKNFSVHVQAKMQDNESFKSDPEQPQWSSQISQQITVSTDVVLHAVQIVDSWQAPEQQQFHALAAISRLQAQQLLSEKIRELDRATRTQTKSLFQQQDKLTQLGMIQRAIILQQERQRLQLMLQVVDKTGLGMPTRVSLNQLKDDFRTKASSISINVIADAESAQAFLSTATGALSQAGLNITSEAKADYTLSLYWPEPTVEQREGWYWYTGNFSFSLRDTQNQIRGHAQWPINLSATSVASAATRMHTQLHHKIEQELGRAVLAFSESQK